MTGFNQADWDLYVKSAKSNSARWQESYKDDDEEEKERKKLLDKYRTDSKTVKIADGTFVQQEDGSFKNKDGETRTLEQIEKLAEIQTNFQNQQQKMKEENNPWKVIPEEIGKAAKQVGSGIVSGMQQGGVKVLDTALKGGAVLDEIGNELQGGTDEEKNARRLKSLENTEKARNWLKSGKDLSGNNFTGTIDDIGVNDLDDPRKLAALAGESLDVASSATMFLNPTRAIAGGATGAKTGLSLGKGVVSNEIRNMTTKEAVKFAGRDAGVFGGVDAVMGGLTEYGESGDVGKAVIEGFKTGAMSAALQGTLDVGGYAAGRAFRKKGPGDPTEAISKGVDDVLSSIEDQKVARQKLQQQGLTYTKAIEDIDARAEKLSDLDYLKTHNLTKTAEAEARYNEIMEDVMNIPGVREATKALDEAETQINYYNEIRVSDPIARKVDAIRDRIAKIEEARQSYMDNLGRMSEDTMSDFDPDSFESFRGDATKKYDEMVAAEQKKIDDLLAANPEKAAELQMLDEAERNVETQRMDAQQALDEVTAQQEQLARQESEKLANEPDPVKIEYHKKALEYQKKKLEEAIEKAQVRADNPNTSLKDVNDEIESIQVGTHPMAVKGASKEALEKKSVELYQQKSDFETKEKAVEVGRALNYGQKIDNRLLEHDIDQISSKMIEDSIAEAEIAKNKTLQKIGVTLQQPSQFLRRMGLTQLANARTDGMMRFAKFSARADENLVSYVKEAKGIDSNKIFAALDGKPGAYEKLNVRGQSVVDKMKKDYYDVGTIFGIPKEYLDRVSYAPHLFSRAGSTPELIKAQVKKADLEESIDKLDGKDLRIAKAKIKKLDEKINSFIDPDKKEAYKDFLKSSGDVNNRFLKERTGAEGYETNPFRAYAAYMDAANRKINFEPFMQLAAKTRNGIDENGTIAKFLDKEISHMSGQPNQTDEALNRGFNELMQKYGLDEGKFGSVLHNAPTKAMKGVRVASSLSHLGFSATTAVNTSQQLIFLPGSFKNEDIAVGFLEANKLVAEMGKNTLTRQKTADFTRMKELGILEGSSRIIPEASINPTASRGAKHLANGFKGAYAGVIGVDRYLRMVTYYAAKQDATRLGLTGKAMDRHIYEKEIEVNQNFSKYEAPQAWRNQAVKLIGGMVNFAPGAIIRTSEIYGKGIKSAADVSNKVVGKIRGEDITLREIREAADGLARAGSFTVAGMVAAQVYDNITGQDQVVPNPFDPKFYSSPAVQFITGTGDMGKMVGIAGLFQQDGDTLDENGKNTKLEERRDKFVKETLPAYFIPGYSQWKRTTDAIGNPLTGEKGINEKGYSETDKGRIRYMTNPDYDLQRAIFGQYSTPEGREYIDNMNKPGGGALSEADSKKIKEAPEYLKQQYYDFFRETDKITGRSDANKEVTRLFRDEKRPEAARRKADEFNRKVDEKLSEFFSKYPDIDDDLKDELRSNVYITLTKPSEAARSRE